MPLFQETFPTVVVPESVVFSFPSRLYNTYEPAPYAILHPEIELPGFESSLLIEKTVTSPFQGGASSRMRDKLLAKIESLRYGTLLEIGDKVIYDARFVFNNNMAHIVQHHLSTLGYVKHALGYSAKDVVVALDSNAPRIALDAFSLCGYPVVLTNRPISGNHIKLYGGEFFHYVKYVSELELNLAPAETEKRIFINRKGTRKLINQEVVSGYLAKRGFKEYFFENVPIRDQWSIVAHADYVVAIHGAALGCLAFMSCNQSTQSPKLIEIFGPGFVVNPFRKYMAVLGGCWVGCSGKVTDSVLRDIDRPGKHKKHAHDDFELSVESLECAISHIGID